MKPLRLILSGSLVLGLALGSFAQSASSSVERARVLQKAGHADQALQLYRDVLQQEPQNLEALADISGLLEAQGATLFLIWKSWLNFSRMTPTQCIAWDG